MERINPNPRFYNTSPQQKVAKKKLVDNSHGKITNKPQTKGCYLAHPIHSHGCWVKLDYYRNTGTGRDHP